MMSTQISTTVTRGEEEQYNAGLQLRRAISIQAAKDKTT